MRRLDRYIFREILPPTFMSLSLYVFLLLMNVLFDVAREAIQNDIGLGLVLKLLYYQLPQLLVVSLPMSVLLGCLIGIGRLSADSEIVAIQAAGIPFRRLVLPTLAVGLSAAGVCFYFIAFVAPEGAYAHHMIKREVYVSRYANAERIVPKVFHATVPGLLLYYDERDAETGAFERVFLYEEDPEGPSERITVARRGQLSFAPDTGRVNLYLEDGSTHVRRLDDAPEAGYSVISFASYQESREAPGYIRAFSGGLQRNLREMSLPQLWAQVDKASRETNEVVRRLRLGQARAEFHERFALPSAALVFALVGLPLGVVNRRGGKASGFALSLGIVLIYWVAYSVLRGAAENGQMDAVLALWLPNAFFTLLAVFLTLTRLRRAPSGTLVGRFRRRFRHMLRLIPGRGHRPTGVAPEPEVSPQPPSFPQLIDRYVAASFLRVFVFVLLSVYLVYTLVEFRSLVGDMVDNRIPLTTVLTYLLFLLPRMTDTILPVACLVATLVGFGLMCRANEDTAVKAAGVSVYRLLLPLLLVTALVCAFGFLLQNEVLPMANQEAEKLRDRIAGRAARTQDPRHRWVISDDGRIFHYRAGDPERGSFQGLNIHELDQRTFALRSRTYAGMARHTGSDWQISNGWIRTFDGDAASLDPFEQRRVALGVDPSLFRSEDSILLWGIKREPEQMSYRDQKTYIEDLERRGYDTLDLRVALARKLTMPLVPLFMVLLGFPFSFRVGAHGSMFGIGLAIGMTVIYWAALAVFNALGTADILPPLIAAWSPNIFFAGLGLYLSLHVRT